MDLLFCYTSLEDRSETCHLEKTIALSVHTFIGGVPAFFLYCQDITSDGL